jgi:predicted acyltransferase
MIAAGLILILIGWLWSFVFPVIKIIWTSSYVLVTAGLSLLLLSLFYFVIDVKGYKKWCMPFVWMGMNSILIYVAAHGLINFEYTSQFVFGGLMKLFPEEWQGTLLWTGVALIQFTVLYFLYRRKWFLKL